MNQTIVKLTFLLFSASLFCYQKSYGLPDDKFKVMQMGADSVQLNQTTHIGNYIGNVELDQGTTHLRAANATTVTDSNNKLLEATARGSETKQAHVWTQTTLDKPVLHAYANEIHYFPHKQLLQLKGKALVQQGSNSFKAPIILYDMKKQQVITKPEGQERTKIVIKNGKLQ